MRNGIRILALSGLLALDSFEPARYESGELFTQPPMTLGGGEVLLELGVAASGEVSEVTVLRTTPPFGDLLAQAVRGWRFSPAREVQEEPDVLVDVDSKVLVVGFFRPPTFYNAPVRGEVPVDVAPPSREVPFPTTMVAPLYPPQVYFHMSQTVAVEVKRRGEIDGVEQLTRYLDLLGRDPLLAPVSGVLAAQEIKPQARVLAADRGIRCVVLDYDALRGIERNDLTLF